MRKIKIACVGDSITFGDRSSDPAVHSYPVVLQNILGESCEVKNFGVSGRTALHKGDFPYREDDTYRESGEFGPDIVILMLGTNDSKPFNWCHGAEFERDLTELAEYYLALSSKPTVYLATTPTAYSDAYMVQKDVIEREIVPAEKKIAKALGLPVINIHLATRNSPETFDDGVHPNDYGYCIMAHIMAGALNI